MLDTQSLQNIGLNEKEAKVYLSLFQLREASVQEIAGLAKINRPNTYTVLNSLVTKGLCSLSSTQGSARYYIESPLNLLSLVRSKKQEVEAQENQAKGIVQELEALSSRQSEDEEPFIRYFSGKRGLLAMRDDMFEEEGSTLRMAYSLDNYVHAFDDSDIKEAHAKRTKKKVFAKVLYNAKASTITDDTTREAKKVADSLELPADLAIYNDKVRLSLFDGTSGVIIKNDKIAQTLKTIFDLAWDNYKETGKESK